MKMHGKWEKKRKKPLWLVILAAVLAVSLLVTGCIRPGEEARLPDPETVPAESTGETLPAPTEAPQTEATQTEPVQPEEAAAEFRVVFLDYDGRVLLEAFAESGGSVTPPADPVRQGYRFTGWDGSYTDITADTTLTAQYTPVPEETKTYTVRFVDYDDRVLKTETVKEGTAATAPADPQREGYTFTGWDKSFSKVTSDLTVKAQYSAPAGSAIVIETVEAAAGSQNTAVTIRVRNNPGIISMKLQVSYGDGLTLTKVEYNPDLGGQSMQPQTLDSPAILNWISPFEDKTGDWVYATLYFTVAEDARGTIPITATYDPNDVFDLTETNITFRVNNGAIHVP